MAPINHRAATAATKEKAMDPITIYSVENYRSGKLKEILAIKIESTTTPGSKAFMAKTMRGRFVWVDVSNGMGGAFFTSREEAIKAGKKRLSYAIAELNRKLAKMTRAAEAFDRMGK